jgi:spermidine/putrescine transport system ATP-binding protein
MAGTSGRGGAVTLLGLVKRYDDQAAVDGIDLAIESGEFFSLLGPSGCGKTTTLRMIAGFERPSGGQVLLDGADMSDVAPERRPVNTVFQSYALFPHLSVADNVAFGLRFTDSDKQTARRRVGEALSLVRLTGFEKRKPGQLSGGQQQRVALARALVLRPRVLLLDEPLSGMGAEESDRIVALLRQLAEDHAILLVEHDMDAVFSVASTLTVMVNGRVLESGTPEQIRSSRAVQEAYLGVDSD